ncbi:MAG: response regulator [Rhodospirillales bacterium]|nr:response regulator [Rhodospirillales bacterium]
MPVKRAIRRATTAGRLIVVVLMLLLCTVIGTIWLVFANARQARDDVIAIYEQRGVASDLLSAIQDAESAKRAYLLTGNPEYFASYEAAIRRVQPLLDALTRVGGTAWPNGSINQLPLLVHSKLDELAETIRLAKAGRAEDAFSRVQGEGRRLMDDIRRVLAAIDEASRAALVQRTAAFERATHLRLLGTVLIIALLFAVLIVAGVLLFRAFRLLRNAEAQAEANAEQLRVSLDSLSQGISVFDAGALLASWNSCFVELFSVPAELLRVGTPYAAFVRHDWTDEEGDFLETPQQLAAAPPEATVRSNPVVYERTRKDGRTFELRRTPVPSGGFVITYTDITQRLLTEHQLRQSQRLDAVGQLTGGIAHDFNNLLTVIIGNLELLRKRSGDLTQSRSMDMALAAAERGASLTRQMLAFARRQPLEPRPLDVNRLLSDVGGFLQRSLGEHIKLETVTSAGLWTVFADPSQLENAILNLALNARDAMPEGGQLTIEAANAELDTAYATAHSEVKAGPFVIIAVTDTGIGMPPDVVARVFEPFFTTKSEGNGSGLGLSQVFGFVKQSNGHIKIYSEVGNGTTIKLYLPRTTQAAVQIARPPEDVVGGVETVLVVEDDSDVRHVALTLLGELGYSCLQASNAHQALEILADPKSAVNVLFTDVILPGGMLGRELARRAQSLNPKLRVLFTSGYTRNAIVHNARVDEDVVFLSKPYKKGELARKLRQVLDASALGEKPAVASEASKLAEAPTARSIIIVEDELMVLWFAVDLLKELGHVPIEATTAAEALALLDNGAPRIDAMVTDLGLPDLRGDALVLEARARRPDLPVVIASGYGQKNIVGLSGLERISYLEKPYNADALRVALSSLGIPSVNS